MTGKSSTTNSFSWVAKMNWQRAAHVATVITGIAAIAALVFTATQLRISSQQGREQASLQREISANSSWERYMEMASSQPKLAAGLEYENLGPDEKVTYLWFVERMLFAGEQVLVIDPADLQWKLAIEIEVKIHKSYLISTDFLEESFCTYTVQLRETVANTFKQSDPNAYRNLLSRSHRCSASGYSE